MERVTVICRAAAGVVVLALALSIFPVGAEPPANRGFQNTWQRTDQPVAAQQVSRTWMWGPEAFTAPLREAYAEAPDEFRTVQYFDKSRMELTDPNADPESIWYVTNGLLVMELATGRMQVGDNQFVEREPADVNVAGDAGVESGVTYRFIGSLRAHPAAEVGATLAWRLTPGAGGQDYVHDEAYAQYGVTAAYHVPETGHAVASVFWDFMRSSGPVYQDGGIVEGHIFPSPFYATGFPITEAYWARIPVAGVERDVLIQCFERRCLTYTPGNPDGWQVEAGNVGRHYYEWRYGEAGDEGPVPQPFPTSGDVRVVFILADPVDYGESEGEYVDIRNYADWPVAMGGWTLEDAARNRYTFPEGFVLGLDATVRVHICNGTNDAANLYWGRCSPVWNNNGDTARLFDAAGNLIHEYSY